MMLVGMHLEMRTQKAFDRLDRRGLSLLGEFLQVLGSSLELGS